MTCYIPLIYDKVVLAPDGTYDFTKDNVCRTLVGVHLVLEQCESCYARKDGTLNLSGGRFKKFQAGERFNYWVDICDCGAEMWLECLTKISSCVTKPWSYAFSSYNRNELQDIDRFYFQSEQDALMFKLMV